MSREGQAQPIVEYTQHLFGTAALASDGVQWSAEVTTGTALNTDVLVLGATVQPRAMQGAPLVEMECGLTIAVKAVSASTAVTNWVWKARTVGQSTWVDLHGTVPGTVGTSYVEYTRSGAMGARTNLASVPVELALYLQCNVASEGRAKVKGSSYVRLTYQPG